MTDSIRYLTIYNAHNGELTRIPKPVRFVSLPKLKTHLLESFTDGIVGSCDNIFLLTPFGIKLEYGMVNEMTELYLFDRRLFQNSGDSIVLQYLSQGENTPVSALKPLTFSAFLTAKEIKGDSLSKTIKEILTILKDYEKWTVNVASKMRSISERTDAQIRQINAIFKALNIIFLFASNFVTSADKNFKSQFNHVKMLAMKSLSKTWRVHFDALQQFPAISLKSGRVVKISELLDENSLEHAAAFVSQHLPVVVLQFNELSLTINDVNDAKVDIDRLIEAHRKESFETFEKFNSERQTITTQVESLLSSVSLDIAALETAHSNELHGYYSKHRQMYSQIYDKVSEMYSALQTFVEFKTKLAQASPVVFDKISNQQMKCVEVRTKAKKLLFTPEFGEKDPSVVRKSGVFSSIKEFEDLLSTTVDLPLLFGFVLVEKRRQFEWHDFYSKGIVNSVSEQLTVIIDHERAFQKLWTKKFGKLIQLMTPGTSMNVHVPAIDVTLVNTDPPLHEHTVLAWLGDTQVEREDVLNFIASVKNHQFVNNSRFSELLERNFKDLIASTEKLKNITKTVVSLGSQSMLASGFALRLQISINAKGPSVENDADLNLIKGLKSRIKKLEDLLHQQQFKNLNGWPVVKSGDNRSPDNRVSLLFTHSAAEGTVKNPINLLPKAALLRKLSQESDIGSSSRKVMDASITIDKHLDNLRLRKELHEAKDKISKLTSINSSLASDLETNRKEKSRQRQVFDDEIASLKKHANDTNSESLEKYKTLQDECSKLKDNHEAEISALKKRLADSETASREKASENLKLEARVNALQTQLEQESSEITSDNQALRDEASTLLAKLSDLQIMNAELLSNMQAKETEFSSERSDFKKTTEELACKLEEKTEDFEDLMEMTQARLRTTEDLLVRTNTSLHALLTSMGGLLVSNMKYFHELCVILESMGLLLVLELNPDTNVQEFKIRRVKGLRSKKDVEDSRPQLERTKSTAVQEIAKGFDWITDFTSPTKLVETSLVADETMTSNDEHTPDSDTLETETRQLLQKCELYVLGAGEKTSKISEFLRTISFEENVHLQAHEDGRDTLKDRFFSNGIIKRFNDVEGFAKKLTKENKAKASELARSVKHSSSKITVKDFQKGDLVLFLPTRIEWASEDHDSRKTITPWTAFNIDAPHYFLDLSSRTESISSEEWIVNRISSIGEHVVTEENAQDTSANPFSLSVGITWFMVKTE